MLLPRFGSVCAPLTPAEIAMADATEATLPVIVQFCGWPLARFATFQVNVVAVAPIDPHVALRLFSRPCAGNWNLATTPVGVGPALSSDTERLSDTGLLIAYVC